MAGPAGRVGPVESCGEAVAPGEDVGGLDELDPGVIQDPRDLVMKAFPCRHVDVEVVDEGVGASSVIAVGANDLGLPFELVRVVAAGADARLGVDDDWAGRAVGTRPGKVREGDDGDLVPWPRVGEAAAQRPSALVVGKGALPR
ncbi:hypothetical protein KEM60_02191 [Austwickia sp. TVS 96-490-7B]|nr:hypothetical protein [Austwickia sp. TVS 96-490-7B]